MLLKNRHDFLAGGIYCSIEVMIPFAQRQIVQNIRPTIIDEGLHNTGKLEEIICLFEQCRRIGVPELKPGHF